MMTLTDKQRKALEAAGYTIGKSGKTIQAKNGGTVGGINENGQFFSGSKKVMEILKTKETPAKSEKTTAKPAAKASADKGMKTSPRPKPRPKVETVKTNSVRPEGKAAGMPAAKNKSNAAGIAGAIGAAAATAAGTRALMSRGTAGKTPRAVTPRNPSYTGKAAMREGFMGKFETGLARAAGKGAGMRRIGPGGANMKAAIDKARDPLMLMAKGGMVKKK